MMKRIISFLLALVVLSSIVPFSVIAANVEEVDNKTEVSAIDTETEVVEEYIYYSDLFYGYSHYLKTTPYFTGYRSETKEILNVVYNDYMDSSLFKWSNIKNSLAMATNLKEWTMMVTDAFGLTSFTYEKALDAANVDFATQLTGGSELAKAYGTETKWVKKLNDILKVYDTFDKNYDVSVMSETEVFTAMFSTINDTDVLTSIDETKITMLQEDILPHISSITSKLSTGADVLTAAKVIATGVMMEDFRMELIDDILDKTPSGTMLHDGMTRMKSQLRNGFTSYFVDNYLSEEVLNELANNVVKKLSEAVLKEQAGAYVLIGAITKVASWIVFDCIFDVPDIDDLTKQMVLSEYSNNLYGLVYNQLALFDKKFTVNDIYKLETLSTAYFAATNAAIIASDKIKLSSNASQLATINQKYGNVNFYTEWIEAAKAFVKNTPVDNRAITNYGIWEISEGTTLTGGSDTIKSGYLYFAGGVFNGNISKDYNNEWISLSIEDNQNLTINGYFYLSTRFSTTTIPKNTSLTVTGQMTFKKVNRTTLGDSTSDAYFYNYGQLTVFRDLIVSGQYSYGFGGEARANFYNYGTLNLKGNLALNECAGTFTNEGIINVENEISLYNRSTLQNNNIIYANTVTLKSNGYYEYSNIYMSNDAFLYLSSHITLDYYMNEACIGGTVVFCGEEVQEISGLIAKNVIVTNPKGIKYLSSLDVYGYYKLNGNPLDNGNCRTYIYYPTPFDTISDYKKVTVRDVCLTLNGNFKGDIQLNNGLNIASENNVDIYGNVTIAGGEFNIFSDKAVIVNGDLKLTGNSKTNNYGTLKVTGNLNNYYSTTNTNNYPKIFNYSTLIVNGNLDSDDRTYDSKTRGYVYQTSSSAKILLGGNLDFYSRDYCNISNGSIVFNGTGLQRAYGLKADTIMLENYSDEGVEFTTSINPSVLFDHKGNNFILYNNGTGSTFVDYDGDGLKDNVDPEPTVGDSCVLSFESENNEKGTVSTDKVETIGGTTVTVTATPTFKYEFVKWINSAGTTMSTSVQWTFVAKSKDETYTAIFSKRQQPITTQCDGGIIDVIPMAEIDSEVSVTIAENDGYVYTDGSLSYNNTPIENGIFVMPDEPVVITAEFVRNENYFLLDDMIATAKGYTYESYSKESFDVLNNAIENAESALVNDITETDSANLIISLQSAIDALENKYITSLSFDYSPMLFVNVPDMINDATVIVTYDNGTKEYISATECTITDYDCSKAGEQTITIEYGGVITTETVLVEKRWLWDCDILGIEDQIYDGIKTEYTLPNLELTYWWTYEQLEEGVDYIIEYENNTVIGQATVTITGMGDYQNSISFNYDIYCIHDFEVDTTVESTCSQEGWYTEKCQICGVTDKEITVTTGLPESSHNYSNNLDKSYYYTYEMADSLTLKFSSSTYTESGWDYIYIYDGLNNLIGKYTGSQLASKSISVTGDTVRIRLTSDSSTVKYGFSLTSIVVKTSKITIPKLEHTEGDWATVDEVSCDSYGTEVLKCVVCGEVLDVRQIPPLAEHSLGDWQIYIEAQFHTDGEERKYCSTCDYYESRIIPKLSESHVCSFTGKEEVVNNPTCIERGSKNVYCYESECGNYIAVDIEAGGHTEGEWIVVSEATCTDDGFVELRCASCDEVMNSEIIEATDHVLGNWYVYIEAKFNTDGEERQDCSACDYYEYRIIPKLSESHVCAFTGKEEVVNNSTCTERGSKNVYCYESECGNYIVVDIEAGGHTEGEWIVVSEATCTDDGFVELRCASCDEVMNSEIIEATDHVLGNWYVYIEAKFNTDGEERQDCSACDYYEYRIIPKLSESHVCAFTGTEEVVINATCTEDGSKNVYCYESECKKFETKAIESKGHTEGKWTITKSVTCTENGTKEQRCTVCNELLATETISFTGHQYGVWVTTKEPTTKEPGEKSRECTVCHESETQRIDPITIEGFLGDANGDGVVNIKDATVIQKYIANLITLTDEGYALADVDGSETVNIKDATAIQKHIAGVHVGFAIGEPVA